VVMTFTALRPFPRKQPGSTTGANQSPRIAGDSLLGTNLVQHFNPIDPNSMMNLVPRIICLRLLLLSLRCKATGFQIAHCFCKLQ
jgi:hypothetical protein